MTLVLLRREKFLLAYLTSAIFFLIPEKPLGITLPSIGYSILLSRITCQIKFNVKVVSWISLAITQHLLPRGFIHVMTVIAMYAFSAPLRENLFNQLFDDFGRVRVALQHCGRIRFCLF